MQEQRNTNNREQNSPDRKEEEMHSGFIVVRLCLHSLLKPESKIPLEMKQSTKR